MKTRLIMTIALSMGFILPTAGKATTFNSVYGSTRGMVTSEPQWSVGTQVGTFGSTAIVAQKVGLYKGAVNLGLGLPWGGLSIHGDYLLFLKENFLDLHSISPHEGYNRTRGLLMPHFGVGLQLGDGFAVRMPLGIQYTMTRDPINFFGGFVPMLRLFADNSPNLILWVHIGARLLM